MKRNSSDYEGVLSSLRFLDENIQPKSDDTAQNLKKIIKKFKVQKLISIFIAKIKRNSPTLTPIRSPINSETQKDQMIVKLQSVDLPDDIDSAIILWDVLMTFTMIIVASFQGFYSDFRANDSQSLAVFILKIISLASFSLKFILNFITADVVQGKNLTYISDIIMNYVKSVAFYIDLGFIILVALMIVFPASMPIGIIAFFGGYLKRFFGLTSISFAEALYINNFTKELYLKLAKVLIFNIFFAHFVSIVLVAMTEINELDNWMVTNSLDSQSWIVQFVYACYWATTIMMTVGFGDYLPVTVEETAILIFVQIFSCIVLAYNISQIGNIISAIRYSNQELKKKQSLFKRMSLKENISSRLQRRIFSYLEESAAIKKYFQYEEQRQLLEQLPAHLRQEFILQANKNLFSGLPFFSILQSSTLIQFAKAFTSKIYYPEEHLNKNKTRMLKIIILVEGVVGLAYRRSGSRLNGKIIQEITTKENNEMPKLLDTSFLSKLKVVNYDLISMTYSFVYDLLYEEFLRIIKESPIDQFHYFHIIDKHQFVQNEWEVIICPYCDPQKHSLFECPRLHYRPLKSQIFLKHLNQNDRYNQRVRNFRRDANPLKGKNTFQFRRNIHQSFQRQKFQPRFRRNVHAYPTFIQNQYQQQKSLVKADLPAFKQQLTHMIVHQIKAIFSDDNCQRDNFWSLELDDLQDYTLYFPLFNPKRLSNTPLSQKKTKWPKSKIYQQ